MLKQETKFLHIQFCSKNFGDILVVKNDVIWEIYFVAFSLRKGYILFGYLWLIPIKINKVGYTIKSQHTDQGTCLHDAPKFTTH